MKILSRIILLSITFMIATTPFSMSAQADDVITPEQTTRIQEIIHDYLVENPQVLIEASDALQQQQEDLVVEQVRSTVAAQSQAIFNGNSPVTGNPNGDVTLVEFYDYHCGYCKRMRPLIKDVIASDSNLRVVFKQFPIFGPESEFAAKAALAADKQGKFYQFHEAVMSEDDPLNQDRVLEIASSIGLDTDQLTTDINSREINLQLENDIQLANNLGLVGTPAMIISNYSVSDGSFSEADTFYIPGETSEDYLKQVIEQARSAQ